MRLTHDQFNLWKSYKIRGFAASLTVAGWMWAKWVLTGYHMGWHGPFPTRQEAILDCMKRNPIRRKVWRRQK